MISLRAISSTGSLVGILIAYLSFATSQLASAGLKYMMKQAIAGVTPAAVGEATIMIVWPSIAGTGFGQLMGRGYRNRLGMGILTLGNLLALLSMPLMALAYLLRKLPLWIRRYRLTNRRVIIERGVAGHAEQYVDLDRFDAIDVVVQPGQEWYPAGDLVFRRGNVETFLLRGVPRPETFRQTCLKAHQAYVGIKKAVELAAAS